jgi:succinyl-CoA synthetase alpha subunit
VLFDGATDRVLVQGVSGISGRRHAGNMRRIGTNIVAGVAPGKGGQTIDEVPVFDTVVEAVDATGATSSVAFLPPWEAGNGIAEAAEAGIRLIVSVTEGIALHDVARALAIARVNGAVVVGPNSPGLAIPAASHLLGFLPVQMVSPGPCALISRSGTLSYEVASTLADHGVGLSIWLGVGGDRIKGSRFSDLVPLIAGDSETKVAMLVGEIGGTDEEDVAEVLARTSLPAVALVAGQRAPAGVKMGHAGAMLTAGGGSYRSKVAALEESGVDIAKSPMEAAVIIKDLLSSAPATRRAAEI